MVLRPLIAAVVLLFVSASAASAADASEVYKAQCAKCHGASGAADTPVGKAMKAPALAGNAKLQKASPAEIATLVKNEAKHPASVKGLSEADLNAAAATAKGLAGK